MKKSKAKGKIKKAGIKSEEQLGSVRNPKIELLSKISELKNIASNSLLKSDYDKAIKSSERIIRLAIKHKMDNTVIEQQNFMRALAEKVQHEYFVSEINETAAKISKIYRILIDSNNFIQAHEILETFLDNYRDKLDLNHIPLIKELINKDKKEWIRNRIEE